MKRRKDGISPHIGRRRRKKIGWKRSGLSNNSTLDSLMLEVVAEGKKNLLPDHRESRLRRKLVAGRLMYPSMLFSCTIVGMHTFTGYFCAEVFG